MMRGAAWWEVPQHMHGHERTTGTVRPELSVQLSRSSQALPTSHLADSSTFYLWNKKLLLSFGDSQTEADWFYQAPLAIPNMLRLTTQTVMSRSGQSNILLYLTCTQWTQAHLLPCLTRILAWASGHHENQDKTSSPFWSSKLNTGPRVSNSYWLKHHRKGREPKIQDTLACPLFQI